VEGEIEPAAFRTMIEEAYSTFRHPAVAPLVQTGSNDWILELFHGPTLAFKDVAMQLLARLMDHVLGERGQRATIVGATSGDTGGAAIEAFRGRTNVDIFILFPEGKVSPVQQRQMTGVGDANVHAIAIEGNFDDCQALVKAMFNDHGFRDRVGLSGVNSINWARIMAQIVYYFSAASNLGSPERRVSFTVPTGNFGDILAGYAAKHMGLPVEKLVIATNQNDILTRTLEAGRYEVAGVHASMSPSMDIQVSSNFERLLFEAAGRDAETVVRLMSGLGQSGAFTLPAPMLEAIRSEFAAGSADETETASTIRNVFKQAGYLADPHTAVGIKVAAERTGDEPMITLATAHPAKFPDAVEEASGIRPELPEWLSDLMAREERYTTLPNTLESVQAHILSKRSSF
jgi:threonine synthase